MPDPSPQSDADRLLQAALAHVPFDGWSDATFRAAAADSGIDLPLARAICPRGAVDLAVAWHRQGDARMREGLAAADLSGLRFRDRVARAVRLRLEAAGDRDILRRGMTLFALPHHALEGAALIWGTSDAIWTALGDTSQDLNWYSKRATLSGVYSATLLYWLGDDSSGHEATWDFLDRRIGEVMQIEAAKARVRSSPLGKALLDGPLKILEKVRAPEPRTDLPGAMVRHSR